MSESVTGDRAQASAYTYSFAARGLKLSNGEMTDERTIELSGHRLVLTARLEPDRDPGGAPREFMPQGRYKNAATARLNAHGRGPFCRINLRALPPVSCVYAVTLEECLVYVGKAANLAKRWGLTQYGSIQPVNCYVGGQSTNCKINHRLLLAARRRSRLELWRHETAEAARVEALLIACLDPPWNG